MTTDVVEKCARAIHAESDDRRFNWDSLQGVQRDDFRGMALAVIDALADGVSDEMCVAAYEAWHSQDRSTPPIRAAIAAAIRAAKSREG